MAFFDTTPAGRILNRFAQDQDDLDAALPLTLNSFLNNLVRVLSTLALAIAAVPSFALVLPPVFFFVSFSVNVVRGACKSHLM